MPHTGYNKLTVCRYISRPTCDCDTYSSHGWWEIWGRYVHLGPHSFPGIQSINSRDKLKKAHSTASMCHFGHITWDLPGCSKAATVGETSTAPVLGYTVGSTLYLITWSPPLHNTGGVVMGGNNKFPVIGDPTVHTCHQCTRNSCGHRKPSTLATATTMEQKHMSRDLSVSTFHRPPDAHLAAPRSL